MELQGSEPPSLANFSTPSLPTLANVRSVKSRERHLSTSLIWIWNSIWRGKLEVWHEPLIVEQSKVPFFDFLANLDLTYYSRGITFLLQSIIFRIVPTALEISMVCGILVRLWFFSLPEFSSSEDNLFRHTNLGGILLLLRLWRWWHTLGSLWGPLHGG